MIGAFTCQSAGNRDLKVRIRFPRLARLLIGQETRLASSKFGVRFAVQLVSRRSGLAEGRRPKRLVINLLVDFLHSGRIFRCFRRVGSARFSSKGEEFFETTRRKSSQEAQGLIREIRKGMGCHFGHVSHIAVVQCAHFAVNVHRQVSFKNEKGLVSFRVPMEHSLHTGAGREIHHGPRASSLD